MIQDATVDARVRARAIGPWDPLVRLTHWSVAAAVLLNGLIVEEESALHQWLGYGAGALLGLRLLWGVLGPAEARFSAFPPRPGAALRHWAGLLAGRDQPHRSHNPLGALMVSALWLTLAVVVGTGIAMADPPWLARPEAAHESPGEGPQRAAPSASLAGNAAQGRGHEGRDEDEREEDEREEEREKADPVGGAAVYGARLQGEDAQREAYGEVLEDIHESAANLLMVLAALHVGGVAVQSRLSGGRELRRMLGMAPRDG